MFQNLLRFLKVCQINEQRKKKNGWKQNEKIPVTVAITKQIKTTTTKVLDNSKQIA